MLNRRADKLELIRIAEAVALEKSIDKEVIINSMETGIAKAAKSKFGQENEIEVGWFFGNCIGIVRSSSWIRAFSSKVHSTTRLGISAGRFWWWSRSMQRKNIRINPI